MFSQISAKARLSSVPSVESEFTRSYTLEASWSRALRTSMDSLPFIDGANCGDAFGCGFESLVHPLARGSADHVVTIERGVERDGGEKVFVELGAEGAQFIDGEIAQFDALLQRE